MEELSEADREFNQGAPAKSSVSFLSHSSLLNSLPVHQVSISQQTQSGSFREILDGKHDDKPEKGFLHERGVVICQINFKTQNSYSGKAGI